MPPVERRLPRKPLSMQPRKHSPKVPNDALRLFVQRSAEYDEGNRNKVDSNFGTPTCFTLLLMSWPSRSP